MLTSPSRSIIPPDNPTPFPAPAKGIGLLQYLSLALCGILSLAFAIVVPPLQVNDEHGHFIRAYAISRGEFVGTGIPKLPEPVAAFVMRYPESADAFHKFTPGEIVRDLSVTGTGSPAGNAALTNANHHEYLVWAIIGSATYCPLVYLPASLGIWMARTLHASPLMMMYAGRIFNVFAFVAALVISFRLAPAYRALITAIALMPMTLHQAGAISGDLVTIAFSFVGLSLVLAARERYVSRRFLIVVAVVFVMWVLCKFSIWAPPLLLLIPASAFKNRRTQVAYLCAVTLCAIGALLIWNGLSAANVAALRAARLEHGVDISANARLATAHPLAFARDLLALVQSNYRSELRQFLGAFGWRKFSLPLWERSLYLLLLVLVAAAEFSTKPFLRWERGVLFLVFFGGVVFVHAVIFISDGTLCGDGLKQVCFNSSAGVQGRYLIPFCLCGLLPLRQSRANLAPATLLAIVTGVGALHALAALKLIRSTFYL